MVKTRVAALLVVAAAAWAAQADEIEKLEKQWVKAVLDKDLGALERILADDLIYGHASGVVDTKRDYIAKLGSGKQVYKTLEQRKLDVRLHGNTAVTHSWVRVTGVNAEGPFDDKIMMLHVWVKQGNAWRLAGHQTARVDRLPD